MSYENLESPIEDFASHLNRDVLGIIFSNLPLGSLLVCRGVCKEWYHLATQDELWTYHLSEGEQESKPLTLSSFRYFLQIRKDAREKARQWRKLVEESERREALHAYLRELFHPVQEQLYPLVNNHSTFTTGCIVSFLFLCSSILIGLGLDNVLPISVGLWLLILCLFSAAGFFACFFLAAAHQGIYQLNEFFFHRKYYYDHGSTLYNPVDRGTIAFLAFLLFLSSALSTLFAWGYYVNDWNISPFVVTLPWLVCAPFFWLGVFRAYQIVSSNIPLNMVFMTVVLLIAGLAAFCVIQPLYGMNIITDPVYAYLPLFLSDMVPLVMMFILRVTVCASREIASTNEPFWSYVLVGFSVFGLLCGSTQLLLYLYQSKIYTPPSQILHAFHSLALLPVDIILLTLFIAFVVLRING